MANELIECQTEVRKWITSIIPVRNPAKTTVKMMGEAVELLEVIAGMGGDPGDECADVFILLIDIADQLEVDLMAEFKKKMQINRNRKWEMKNGALVHTA